MSRHPGPQQPSTHPWAVRLGLVLAAGLAATASPAARAQSAPPPAAASAQSPAAQSPATQSAAVQSAAAQSAAVQSAAAQSAAAPPTATAAPDVLVLHFNTASSAIRPEDVALLDQASRLYRDAHPILMIVTAGSDTVGAPEQNLRLSQARAEAVLHGLVTRGIPAERFQLLAKGVSDLSVPTPLGVADERNRRVEIRWR